MTGQWIRGRGAMPGWTVILASSALALTHVALAAQQHSPPASAGAQVNIVIEDAWVRAMPPSQPNTAAYMTVRNQGSARVRIIGANSELAARVEIHTSREVDGMVRMEQLEGLTLEPGQQAPFSPGGMHLMMLGLNRMPAPGEQVKLCLQFETGASACAAAQVRRVAPSPDDKMHDAHQHH